MGHFLCTLTHGPAWDGTRGIREQAHWAEHAAFMDRLVEDGLIVLGGPIGDGSYSAHLISADDEAQIRARLGEDPWALDGHLAIGLLEPWSLWLRARTDLPQ